MTATRRQYDPHTAMDDVSPRPVVINKTRALGPSWSGATIVAAPLFLKAPTLAKPPIEVFIFRGHWCAGVRWKAVDGVWFADVIGAYLLSGGVSAEDLRDCAHLWPWSAWARQVDDLNRRAVEAHRIAAMWRAHGSADEHRERAAGLLEQELIALFARQGVSLLFVGDFPAPAPAEAS